jgi:hypothetical protein
MKKDGDARETEEILDGLTGYLPQSTEASIDVAYTGKNRET